MLTRMYTCVLLPTTSENRKVSKIKVLRFFVTAKMKSQGFLKPFVTNLRKLVRRILGPLNSSEKSYTQNPIQVSKGWRNDH